MCHFEKKIAEYKTRVFQRDSANIFGRPNFTSICFVDKDLIYVTANIEIYQLDLQRNGLGLYAEASLVTKAPNVCCPVYATSKITSFLSVMLEF